MQEESPAPLITALEWFVALLRNKAGTKPVDVELFMKSDEKLKAKMKKTETTSCELEIVNQAYDKLQSVRGNFGRPAPGEIDISRW